MLKKKIWANFQRIIELFTQKIVTKLSKIWVWDPGSEIRDLRSGIQKKPIPDPGSRVQGSKRHRIPDPDPQHCIAVLKICLCLGLSSSSSPRIQSWTTAPTSASRQVPTGKRASYLTRILTLSCLNIIDIGNEVRV